MPREDNRLTDGAPMLPLSCPRCGNQVRVRKSSWQQTSVQWDAQAMLGCPERQAGGPGEDRTAARSKAAVRSVTRSGRPR